MDHPRKSPAACYIDRDGVAIPVDLEGNEIIEEAHPVPEAASPKPDVRDTETKPNRGK